MFHKVNKSTVIKAAIVMTVLALLLYSGFCFLVAYLGVKPVTGPLNISPSAIGKNNQDITVTTRDKIKLKGWLFRSSSDKLVILVTGYAQNRLDNDYGGYLIAKDLVNNGYNVLIYDDRATGLSGGNYMTQGMKESLDLLSVVSFARSIGFKDQNIALIGNSLGAIVILQDCDRLPSVGAMVIDSAAFNVKGIMENILQNQNHINKIFNPGIFFILKHLYGIDFSQIQPAEHILKAPERIFLYLHGALDTTIYPVESKKLLAISNPNSRLVVFPNATHVQTYKSDPGLYRQKVFSFLSQNLEK